MSFRFLDTQLEKLQFHKCWEFAFSDAVNRISHAVPVEIGPRASECLPKIGAFLKNECFSESFEIKEEVRKWGKAETRSSDSWCLVLMIRLYCSSESQPPEGWPLLPTWVTSISSVVIVLLFWLVLFQISGQLCGKVITFLNFYSVKIMLLGKWYQKSNQFLLDLQILHSAA